VQSTEFFKLHAKIIDFIAEFDSEVDSANDPSTSGECRGKMTNVIHFDTVIKQ
jgi:hypothetical protein